MTRLIVLCVFLITQLCLMDIIAQTIAFFRKDYAFLAETQSFYKVHTIQRNWMDAKKRCALEGASLFYPEDDNEANVVITYWNNTQPTVYWTYIGVSDLISKHVFETIDGTPIDDIYNRWGAGEPNDINGNEDCVILRRDGTINDDSCFKKYPFICKKRLDDVHWNIFCDLPDPKYLYNAGLGKCYKFHLNPLNWTDAYSVCAAEQSYLATINSQEECNYLVNLTASVDKDNVQGNYMRGAVALGFHNKFQEGWKTIKGTTLEEAGYSKWGYMQPDGGINELCGTMFYNGHLNDLSCSWATFFICEHDINSLSTSFDERFNIE